MNMKDSEKGTNKFSFFENDYGEQFLIVQSEWLEEQIEYCKEKGIENLFISWYKGFFIDSIDFIDRIKLKRIIIDPFNIKSLRAINNQNEIVFLGINSDPVKEEIDFENFQSIEIFKGFWTKKLKNLLACKSLKVLWLWQFKSSTWDLRELAGLENLEELHIIQSNIKTCKGLGQLKNLRKIGLGYNKNLETFTDENPEYQLREIEIEVCRNLDLSTLTRVDQLHVLKIINNGKMASLKPVLKKMSSLKELQFTESELTETNNLYLLQQPSLEHVWLSDKKHYLLNTTQINEALKDVAKKKAILQQHL